MDFVLEIVTSLVVLGFVLLFGQYRGAKGEKIKAKEKELKSAKEVLEVKPSADLDAATKRLSRNGKLRSLRPKPTDD